MTYYLTYFFKYAQLKNARGHLAAGAELGICFLISASLCVLFLADMSMNVISEDGLIDRIGQLTSVLTGFFVAALVAISAFTIENSALDEEITVGKVFDSNPEEGPRGLTRREYVCYMFGYLVGVSFVLSSFSVLIVSFRDQLNSLFLFCANLLTIENSGIRQDYALAAWKVTLVFLVVFFFSHVVLVSLRGIFYLMDKLYDKKSVLLKKPKSKGHARLPVDPPKV